MSSPRCDRLPVESLEPRTLFTAPPAWSDVNDFLYQLQNADLGAIGRTQYDLVVLDYSREGDDASRFTANEIRTLQQSTGGKRVLSYLSIGEAEDYRWYWQPRWDRNGDGRPDAGRAPKWLGTENPDWEGNYRVKYWQGAWQDVAIAYLDKVIDAGFDGVYLDIVDAYEYWGPDGRNVNPSAERDMVDFVKRIAQHARVARGKTDFAVFVQNAEHLSTHADYLQAVTGIGREDVFYNGNATVPASEWRSVARDLDRFKRAGKPVLVIDYPQKADRIEVFYTKALNRGYVPFAADRELDKLTIRPGHEPD